MTETADDRTIGYLARERERLVAENARLRSFAQWVADHSNDPVVVHQAVLHGADLAKEQTQ